jgi:hypothetical protein
MTYPTSEVGMPDNADGALRPAEAEQSPSVEAGVPDSGGLPAPDSASAPPAEADTAAVTEGPTPDDQREVWDRAQADRYRDQWRELQLRFVDDPSGATKEAAALVDDAVQALTASLQQQTRAIADQNSGNGADTENQLSALREYRALFNRMLEL